MTANDPDAPVGGSDPSVSSPPWDQPTDMLDVYRRATDSMRDATKWIMAFVPGAGLVLALADLIPKLAGIKSGSDARTAAIGWIAGGTAAALVALVAAARVLTAGPVGFGELLTTYSRDSAEAGPGGPMGNSLAAELDTEAVLRLYGYTSASEFFEQLALEPSPRKSAVAAGTAALDFAAYRVVRGRFRSFGVVGVMAVLVAVVCLALASFTISAAPVKSAHYHPAQSAARPANRGFNPSGGHATNLGGVGGRSEGRQFVQPLKRRP